MAKSKEEQDEADAADAEAAAAVAAAVEAANVAEDGDGQVIQKKIRREYVVNAIFKKMCSSTANTHSASLKKGAQILRRRSFAQEKFCTHRCVHAKLIRRIRRVCLRDSPKKCSHKETHMAKLWKKVNTLHFATPLWKNQ